MSSFFNSSMGKLLVGTALSEGAGLVGDYFKENIYEDSFLQRNFEEYIEPYNPFSSATGDKVYDAFGDTAKKVAVTGASQMLSQGLGVDPRTGQNMPSINVSDGNTYASRNKNFNKGNYQGLPQGSYKVLENAFKDPRLQQIALDYKQARMPNIKVTSSTVAMGSSTVGNLDKGIIKGVKN